MLTVTPPPPLNPRSQDMDFILFVNYVGASSFFVFSTFIPMYGLLYRRLSVGIEVSTSGCRGVFLRLVVCVVSLRVMLGKPNPWADARRSLPPQP
jgi:hypothetical protein